MKNKTGLNFRVHTPNLLKEIINCAIPISSGVLKVPLNEFQKCLARVADRAIELNDPILNKLMFDLALYDDCEPNGKNYIGPKIMSDYRRFIKQQNSKKPVPYEKYPR